MALPIFKTRVEGDVQVTCTSKLVVLKSRGTRTVSNACKWESRGEEIGHCLQVAEEVTCEISGGFHRPYTTSSIIHTVLDTQDVMLSMYKMMT